jgi:hypothetical protein
MKFLTVEQLIKIKSRAGVQLTDPELAIRWYNRLEPSEKESIVAEYLPSYRPDELSNEDKYWLWRAQQKL